MNFFANLGFPGYAARGGGMTGALSQAPMAPATAPQPGLLYGGMPDDNGNYGASPDPYGGMPDDNGNYGASPAATSKKPSKWSKARGKLKAGLQGIAAAQNYAPEMQAPRPFEMLRRGLLG